MSLLPYYHRAQRFDDKERCSLVIRMFRHKQINSLPQSLSHENLMTFDDTKLLRENASAAHLVPIKKEKLKPQLFCSVHLQNKVINRPLSIFKKNQKPQSKERLSSLFSPPQKSENSKEPMPVQSLKAVLLEAAVGEPRAEVPDRGPQTPQ
jgi:hypothetical protein